MRGRVSARVCLCLSLSSAACADKAPPALFPRPDPPELARPRVTSEPACVPEHAPEGPTSGQPTCETEAAPPPPASPPAPP